MNNEEIRAAIEEFNANADPILPPLGTPRDHTKRVNSFAEEIVDYILNELDGGDWHDLFQELTLQERAALFMQISDAFGDTVDD